MNNDDELLTTKQAAEFLGITKTVLENSRGRNDGPPCIQRKPDRRKLWYNKADLLEWLKNHPQYINDPGPELLTRKETAKLLGVSAVSLTIWAQYGNGPPYKRFYKPGQTGGKHVYYRRTEALAWLAKRNENLTIAQRGANKMWQRRRRAKAGLI